MMFGLCLYFSAEPFCLFKFYTLSYYLFLENLFIQSKPDIIYALTI